MQKTIVSDTSCLILLSKIGKLSILKSLFASISVTGIIAKEFGDSLPDFIKIENPKNRTYQRILENTLDAGEASAIALALEKDKCLLILDDLKGRKEAKKLGISYTGTIGILIVAKEKGLISSISEVLDQIENTDFRLSKALIEVAKRKTKE